MSGIEPILTIFGYITKLLGLFIPKRFKMPKIILGQPQQLASEPFLAWWHVPISTKQRWLGPEYIDDCRVRVVIKEPAPTKELNLFWSSVRGPEEKVRLRVGEPPQKVPIVVRSEIEVWLTGDPVRLPKFLLPAWIARITDQEAIFQRTNFTDLQPSASYKLWLQILSGANLLASSQYRLYVPGANETNEQFVLTTTDDP